MALKSYVSEADSAAAAAALFAWVRGSAPAFGDRLRGFGDPGAPGVCVGGGGAGKQRPKPGLWVGVLWAATGRDSPRCLLLAVG